ncbi:hypothetical protein COCNU_scaffold004647G000040 [Cocos nucifera]|nr:hypothetical protein [Cocos nucifera]
MMPNSPATSLSDNHLLAYIKKVNHLKSKSSRVQENLQAEVDHLWERTAAADRLLEEKTVEEERRKKDEVRIAELKDETSRQISEAKIQVTKEFKVSSEMMDLNIAFSHETFQKGYELCEDRVARKFSELDLDFLYGDIIDEEARPSAVPTDPCPAELALEPSKPAIEAPKPVLEPKVVPEAPGSPAAPSTSAEPILGSVTVAGAPSSSPISPSEDGGS